MPTEDNYAERAKRLLRTEMVRNGVNYEIIAERLTAIGMPEPAVNLRNKVSRGKFTSAFLLTVCDASRVAMLRTAKTGPDKSA